MATLNQKDYIAKPLSKHVADSHPLGNLNFVGLLPGAHACTLLCIVLG